MLHNLFEMFMLNLNKIKRPVGRMIYCISNRLFNIHHTPNIIYYTLIQRVLFHKYKKGTQKYSYLIFYNLKMFFIFKLLIFVFLKKLLNFLLKTITPTLHTFTF